ncbi:MAG: NAD(P)/FAD-dependent oxidoreductase, partial [Candidatus Thermoplasmatota archaeon]|nr:NAD(P)/FAD-dependent oxidoreductase [Candidatus Thermoplasmatota archaeon]
MKDYDVVVVGAGPGGGMAAWMAAKSGASLLVVDRKKVVGEPVRCAEGTFSSMLDIFDLHQGPWIVNKYDGAIVKSPGRKDINIKLKRNHGLSLDRALFEQEIVKRAKKAGANFIMERVVTGFDGKSIVLHDGSSVSGKVFIGADGVESMLGRWAGITKPLPAEDIAPGAQYVVRGRGWEANMAQIIVGTKISPGGYIWVFPKSKDVANVGAVTNASTGRRAIDILDDYVKKNLPGLEIIKKTGGCVPVGMPLDSAAGKNVMLVGDAGHFASAFGAGGIHSALFTGALAGKLAGEAVSAGGSSIPAKMAEYDQTWKKAFYKNLARSYRLKTKTYGSQKG